ncbi:MAG: TRAP transporter large permease subunit [Proteobacteria bacterium]|nr:TRAP transporter large permease subunit [Pseudomonadota bacterium]MBU1452744.1 TRAP transporter large permease subunit [Pseudomonadota bacterium]MBU2467884.1 TRAP transporter large permease subunit [Pseudomonadota bacterium]MBU2519381.1 TRAP transporter large permease subunit [Pseudomonadota bacterium]
MLSFTAILMLLFLVLVLLAVGIPIGFALGGVSVLGVLVLMGPSGLFMLFATAYGEVTNYLLIAVPLYIFMANMLGVSNLADDLFQAVHNWFGRLRGGLAMGTVVICALFAAMAGISSVATVAMGLIALPAMLKRGYHKDLAVGSISAGGALGILIPPSIIMIIYGSIAEVSIGQLFMGGVIPGILLTAIFVIYIGVRCFMRPSLGPPIEEYLSFSEKVRSLKGVILPLLLIASVLGVIYFGVCTPTEAAAIGAAGSLVCCMIYRKLTFRNLYQACIRTLRLNAMVLWIMIGAVSFSHLMSLAGLHTHTLDLISKIQAEPWVILVAMQLTFFILGMFLDPAGVIMITTPVFLPIVNQLGFDPVWFGVLFVINMEMAYLTPPFGFNLFIMKGVVPPNISMGDIYRSIIPYVVLQAICLILVIVFPQLVLWLPQHMVVK